MSTVKSIPEDCCLRPLSVFLIIVLTIKNVFTAGVEMAVLGSILAQALGIPARDPSGVQLFSKLVFVLVLYNLAQSWWGTRLPVMHSPNLLCLGPVLYYIAHPTPSVGRTSFMDNFNLTALTGGHWFGEMFIVPATKQQLDVTSQMQLLQGCCLVMATVQMVCALPVIHLALSRFVPPITLAACVLSIPITLQESAVERCSQNILITMGTLILLSIIAHSKICKLKSSNYKINIGKLLAIPIALSTIWTICALLTHHNIITEASNARVEPLNRTWSGTFLGYHYKHLFEWYSPKFSPSSLSMIVPSLIVTIPLSLLNYKTAYEIEGKKKLSCKKLSCPVTRSLLVEALGYLMGGVLGGATGYHQSFESLQNIADTKMWTNTLTTRLSCAALLLISLSKPLCVYLTLMPAPLLGSMLVILCVQQLVGWLRILAAKVDLLSTRNLYIVAMSNLVPYILTQAPTSLLSNYSCHLLLVVPMATVLNHVLADELSNVECGDVTDSVSKNLDPEGQHNRRHGICEQLACCCSSCFL